MCLEKAKAKADEAGVLDSEAELRHMAAWIALALHGQRHAVTFRDVPGAPPSQWTSVFDCPEFTTA